MWFIGVEVEQETSAPPPKKNPGSAPARGFPSGTKQKNVYHLHPNRSFREFVVNGKQPLSPDTPETRAKYEIVFLGLNK